MMFQYVKHSFLSGSRSSVWRRVSEGAPAVKQTHFAVGDRASTATVIVLHWLSLVNKTTFLHWNKRWTLINIFPHKHMGAFTLALLANHAGLICISITRFSKFHWVAPEMQHLQSGAKVTHLRARCDVVSANPWCRRSLPSPPVQACFTSAHVCAGGTREKRRF